MLPSVTITIVAHDVGFEDESPMLMVGIAESAEEESRAFVFQADLRRNAYLETSNWPGGKLLRGDRAREDNSLRGGHGSGARRRSATDPLCPAGRGGPRT